MRLWHQDLISKLPRQQLLGQHRECCALRGNSWGKKHVIVDYVFTHEFERLIAYHSLIMDEMHKRGYKVAKEWLDIDYRGKVCGYSNADFETVYNSYWDSKNNGIYIYPEHNESYLIECIDNLKGKGIMIA